MDESDNSDQLPLPAMPARAGAPVIRLPLPAPRPRNAPKTGSRPPLWYALHFPQLGALSDSRRREVLRALASRAESVSATVSLHERALVCEVRSSLRYFGGLDSLHRHLEAPLAACLAACLEEYLAKEPPDATVWYAAAPTVTGSLLLARAGHNAVVYRPDNLRSALGRLGTDVLELGPEASRRLYNMGVRCLRDIWRLPMDGLRRRFGSDLVNLLHKALGQAPEPTHNYTPPPAFGTSYDLPYGVENLDRLLPVADEMLARLCDFLTRRDLSCSLLAFALGHEQREPTRVELGLRQPSRCHDHLLGLLETHFSRLAIPAPVASVTLSVTQFDAFFGHSDSLLAGQPAAAATEYGGNLNLFMEQLRARLGGQPVKRIHAVAEHCPEYACQQQDYDGAPPARTHAAPRVTDRPRPLWLLPQPEPLTLKNGRLYHRRALTILRGPERIETRWWAGEDIRRDYYIAREDNGSRLWIYRERRGRRHWYLHGIFA